MSAIKRPHKMLEVLSPALLLQMIQERYETPERRAYEWAMCWEELIPFREELRKKAFSERQSE